jgi:ATP-dependent Zn protease
MSDRVGVVAHQNRTGERMAALASEETRAAIDEEVKRLTDEAHAHARTILREKETLLHKLAAALVERETLTGDEVREILGVPAPLRHSDPPAAAQPGDAKGKPKGRWF